MMSAPVGAETDVFTVSCCPTISLKATDNQFTMINVNIHILNVYVMNYLL